MISNEKTNHPILRKLSDGRTDRPTDDSYYIVRVRLRRACNKFFLLTCLNIQLQITSSNIFEKRGRNYIGLSLLFSS